MTHISKKEISKKIWEKIFNQFSLIISGLSGRSKTGQFVNDFFTPTERIMFAKRLAIIFMLNEEVPISIIVRELKVSSQTVLRMTKILDKGGYEIIVEEVKKEKNKEELWDMLEDILSAGLPKRGKGRWKNLYKMTQDNFKKN